MADPPGDPTRAEDGRESAAGAPPRSPRWVKVACIIVAALVLVFVVLKVLGVGGQHGPIRHMSTGVSDVSALSVGATALLES